MSDTYNYTAPARVKTLLVPVNQCTQADFHRYLSMIRSTPSEVRLLDITPNNQLQFFNPQTFPKGRILLDLLTAGADSESIFLHDFEPFRKTFVIVGIGKWSGSAEQIKNSDHEQESNQDHQVSKSPDHSKEHTDDETSPDPKHTTIEGSGSPPINSKKLRTNLSQEIQKNVTKSHGIQGPKTPKTPHEIVSELKRLYPSSIVQNLILFDTPSSEISTLTRSETQPQQVFFHEGVSSPLTALETIFCDISRNFLTNLDSYASSYSNITLRSPVSITDSHILTKTINQAQKRLSSGSTSFKVSFSNSPTTSSPTTDSKSKPQIRQIARQSKLMGNFYLLAGKYQDALQSFIESLTSLKKCEDFLWLGGALEGIGISINLLQLIGVGFQMPNQIICSVLQLSKSKLQAVLSSVGETSARSSSEGASNGSNGSPNAMTNTNNNSTPTINGHIKSAASRNSTYSPRNSVSSSSSFNFSSTPDFSSLPLPECIKLISSKVSQLYNLSTNDFENMVPDIVYVESILRIIRYMIKTYLEDSMHFLKSDILHEIEKIFSLHLVDMNIADQCRIYCSLASMYTDLGMLRKRAFILKTLLVGLLPQFRKKLISEVNKSNTGDQNGASHNITTPNTFSDNASVTHEIFEYLFSIYGIQKETESSSIAAFDHVQSNWTSLQVLVLKSCMQISEAIKDYLYLLKICILLLTRFTHCLPADDQVKLKEKIESIVYFSNRFNLGYSSPYWDPFVVRRVKLVTKSRDDLTPYEEYEKNENKVGLVDTVKSGAGTGAVMAPNGTGSSSTSQVFNPYNKVKSTLVNREKLLIKDDFYQLKVQLQNPFAFDVEINDITIVTDGKVEVQTLKSFTRSLGSINARPVPIKNRTNTNSNIKRSPFIQQGVSGVNAQNGGYFGAGSSPLVSGTSSAGAGALSQPTLGQSSPSQSLAHTGTLIIPANSSENFLVSFKPLDAGELNIVGFNISIGCCDQQLFKIVDKENFERTMKITKAPTLQLSEESKSYASTSIPQTLSTSLPVLSCPSQLSAISSPSILTKLTSNLSSNNISNRVSTKTFLLTVIPPQPTLSLTEILVTNGWLMLLEGERFQFSISLTNHSDELINYLSFSFWDSTIDPLSKKLSASAQLTAPEIYEIEWYLLKCKPFRILNKNVISEKYKTIAPRSNIKIDYEVTAKRNMKELKIILEYSNKDSKDVGKSFVKSVDVPLNFTIIPSLEIVGCDVIPLFSSSLHGFDGNSGGLVQENLEKVMKFITDINHLKTRDISDYCLLIIDLRNSFSEKLKTRLVYEFGDSNEKDTKIETEMERMSIAEATRIENGKCSRSSNTTTKSLPRFEIIDCIEPGKTSRLLLPIKRISNQDTDLTLAIPSLRNKQFIKNYSVSEQEELKIREMFWLRSVILEKLQGTWESVPTGEDKTETGVGEVSLKTKTGVDEFSQNPGSRFGNIELRNIRLTPKMASILVYNQIRLVNTIFLDEDPHVPIKKVGTQYILETEHFYTMRTTIVNSSDKPIRGILRHLPFSVQVGTFHPSFVRGTIDRKILINGVLQNHTGTDVGPGDSMVMDLSFLILERGEYEWGSILDVLDVDLQIVGREPVMIAAV